MIELDRPRDISALFGDSFGVFFRHAGAFIALSAAVVVPALLVVQGIGMEQLTAAYDESPELSEWVVPTLVSFLVVSPLVTAICIHALRSVAAGGRPGAGRALVSGFEAFAPIFLAVVLATLGIALGLLALVAPGIYLFVRWFFVPQAVVIEGARGPDALRHSSAVVQGFWWRTCGLVVVVQLAILIPGLVLTAPFTAIAASTEDAAWALVGAICAECVTAPFAAIFSTLLYYDLRARRAGAPA